MFFKSYELSVLYTSGYHAGSPPPWKGYLKKTQQIKWQEGFFEHRIRDQDSMEEKEHYLRMNPVRVGLVHHWEEWPYIWPESTFLIR